MWYVLYVDLKGNEIASLCGDFISANKYAAFLWEKALCVGNPILSDRSVVK